LFAKLLDAIGPDTRIILLGDKDQLASVEAGSLLGDLCQAQAQMNFLEAGTIRLINLFIPGPEKQIPADHTATAANVLFEHIIELKRSHRFTGTGGIGKFSKAVINGDLDTLASFAMKTRKPSCRSTAVIPRNCSMASSVIIPATSGKKYAQSA
jgi:exodeoxyribonuclease V alpha subunit